VGNYSLSVAFDHVLAIRTLSAFGAAVDISGTLGLATLLPHAGIGILVFWLVQDFEKILTFVRFLV
jgi:hypothetical protein